jgi:hypothetical protein
VDINHAASVTRRKKTGTLAREASWVKLKKAMGPWKVSTNLWAVIEKGIQHYTRNVSRNKKGGGEQCPGTFNNPRNLLRQALREQDEIGWSGLFKGRVEMQWEVYTEQHPNAK